jgi:NADH-quinone oxidoreductase subunit N
MEAVSMTLSMLALISPQLLLTAGILAVLVYGFLRGKPDGGRSQTVVLGLLFLALSVSVCLKMPGDGSGTVGTLLSISAFSRLFLIIAALATAITLVLAGQSKEIPEDRFPEFTALLITICLGVSLMAAARELLIMYLAIETVSLSSYVLTGFKRAHPLSHEAALKYVIFGGVASGLMLFGMSLLFGFARVTTFEGIALALQSGSEVALAGKTGVFAIFMAMALLLAGLCFKIAAVPFHMWCPDVYQGAPTPFTGFLSVAPKAGGFAILLRFIYSLLHTADIHIKIPILAVIGIISVVTMTAGNLSAIYQKNVKRMLAYSSIAHAGYMLMGLVVLDKAGFTAIVLYLIVYLFMNLGAFAVIQVVADQAGSEDIKAYRGLGYRSSFLAVLMSLFLFSLAGIPPLSGFIGKFYLFAALLQQGGLWHILLAIMGILNSTIALFYYTLIVREMFLRQPEVQTQIKPKYAIVWIIALLAIPTILLGLYWEPIFPAIDAAASALTSL